MDLSYRDCVSNCSRTRIEPCDCREVRARECGGGCQEPRDADRRDQAERDTEECGCERRRQCRCRRCCDED